MRSELGKLLFLILFISPTGIFPQIVTQNSNSMETSDEKLLQVVLVGQPELREKLNSPSLRQLRQRISVRYHIGPLRREEVLPYVLHRLNLAGANGSAPMGTTGDQTTSAFKCGFDSGLRK